MSDGKHRKTHLLLCTTSRSERIERGGEARRQRGSRVKWSKAKVGQPQRRNLPWDRDLVRNAIHTPNLTNSITFAGLQIARNQRFSHGERFHPIEFTTEQTINACFGHHGT